MPFPSTDVEASLLSAFQLFVEGKTDFSNHLREMAALANLHNGSGIQSLRQALSNLLSQVISTVGEDHIHVANLLSAIANLESILGPIGDQLARNEAIRRVIAIHDRMQNPTLALQAVLGLANAQSDARQWEDALVTYRDAELRAEQIGNLSLTAQVQRNHGLCLSESGRMIEAEALLRTAVFSAACAIDGELLGRVHVALGVFLQHNGRKREAIPHLKDAIQLLNTMHPDAICAQAHLAAADRGDACSCGNQQHMLAEALREFVLPRLPNELVERLDVNMQGATYSIHINLRRSPTVDEETLLNHILREAHQHLWR